MVVDVLEEILEAATNVVVMVERLSSPGIADVWRIDREGTQKTRFSLIGKRTDIPSYAKKTTKCKTKSESADSEWVIQTGLPMR